MINKFEILTDLTEFKNSKGVDYNKITDMPIDIIYMNKKYTITLVKIDGIDLYFKDIKRGVIERINKSNFKKGALGKVLGLITSDFKVTKNILKDDKRDFVITSREHRKNKKGKNEKWYKYTCNKCGWTEGWIVESALLNGQGCSCCSGRNTVLGINTIYDTHRFLIDDFGLDEEFAKTHTYGTGEKGFFTCKDCGGVIIKYVYNVIANRHISCNCSDGHSFPEKFMMSVLNQLGIEFITQLSNTNFKWCDKFRYDFYIPKYNMIIETHGMQHYEETGRKGARTLQEEQENDNIKKELALINSVEHYVVVDCRKSELEWIKNSILNSKLNNLFDLSIIDWNKCEEFALKNIIKEVCNYWKNRRNCETTSNLVEVFGLSNTTIINYLKKGTKLGWCNYDARVENSIVSRKNGKLNSKLIEIFKDGVSLGIFESASELERRSEELLGIKIWQSNIQKVCAGKLNETGGYLFKYVKDAERLNEKTSFKCKEDAIV